MTGSRSPLRIVWDNSGQSLGDIAFLEGIKAPFYEKSSCALFDFLGKFKKGAEYL